MASCSEFWRCRKVVFAKKCVHSDRAAEYSHYWVGNMLAALNFILIFDIASAGALKLATRCHRRLLSPTTRHLATIATVTAAAARLRCCRRPRIASAAVAGHISAAASAYSLGLCLLLPLLHSSAPPPQVISNAASLHFLPLPPCVVLPPKKCCGCSCVA
eukprot:6185807-Pleurochrysis_carterae.AAC.5